MRAAGLLDHPSGVERGDHVCWAYERSGQGDGQGEEAGDRGGERAGERGGEASFEEAALRFLAEGRQRGERLLWVGNGVAPRLRRSGGPLAEVEDLTARGVLRLLPLAEAYARVAGFSADEQLAFYDDATRRALDEGFTGLRVVAEITELAADPRRRPELLRWEQLADEYVARGTGFSALCAYSRSDLPAETLTELASLHPVVHVPAAAPPFRVWFDAGRILVAGEVDAFGADRFRRILTAAPTGGPTVTLDLSGVGFIDLAGCRAIVGWAQQLTGRSGSLELVGASRVFRRIWHLLHPTGVPGTAFRDGLR